MREKSSQSMNTKSRKSQFRGGETRAMKKTLSSILAFALVLTLLVPAFAFAAEKSTLDKFNALKEAGILDGVNAEGDAGLDQSLTRAQLAKVLVKVLGLTPVAGTGGYADVAATHWAATQGWIVPVSEAGLMTGVGYNNFGPDQELTFAELAIVVVKALGLEVDETVTMEGVQNWAAPYVAVALANGILPELEDYHAVATRGDLVEATYTVYEFTQPVDELTATADVVGAKKFAVTFNQAVDTKGVSFSVKRGSVNVNVASVDWNDAKTTATLTTVSKLIAGTYTITVSGTELSGSDATFTVEVQAEKVTAIEILSDIAPLDASDSKKVSFAFVVKNQYGEDVTSTASLKWTASQGEVNPSYSTGFATVESSANFVRDQALVVTALDQTTGTFTSKTLKVGDPAKVSTIKGLSLYHEDGESLTTASDYSEFYVVVDAVDQYGNKVSEAQLENDLTVIVSNPAVLDVLRTGTPSKPNFTENKLQLVAPSTKIAGTAVVRVLSNFTGSSQTLSIEVTAAAALDYIVLEAPADLVVKGEKVEIPFTAFDQYGNELSEKQKAAIDKDLIKSTDSAIKFGFSYNYKTNKAVLTLDATDTAVTTGQKVIIAVTSTGKQSQIVVDVKAEAKPVAVSAVKDLVTNMTAGAKSTITPNNLVVTDQYGREMKLDDNFFTKYRFDLATSAAGKVGLSGNQIAAANGSVELSGVAAGNSTVSVEVYDLSKGTVANSKFDFVANTVAKSAIAEYVVETPELIYDDGAKSTHAKPISVYGKLSNGSKVALATTDYSVTTSDPTKFALNGDGKLDANGVSELSDSVKEVEKAVIVVINGANGPVTFTKTVKITNVPPVLTTIAVDSEVEYLTKAQVNVADSANVKALFKGKDQYGVSIDVGITNVIYSDVSSKDIVITNNGQAAPGVAGAKEGDTFKVTIVGANGLTKEVNVVVIP